MATFFVADLFDLIFHIWQLVSRRRWKGIQNGAEKVNMEVNCCSSNEVNSSSNGLGIFHQTELAEGGNCRSSLEDREMESLAASKNVCNENSLSNHLDDDGVKMTSEKYNDEEMVHFQEVSSNTAQLTHEIIQTSIMCDLAPALGQKLNEESDQLDLIDNGLVKGIDKMTIEENEGKLCANKDAVESIKKEDDNIVQEVNVNGQATTQDVTDKGLVQSISEFNANGKRRQSVADLKNMFESFSEDPSVDDELEDKLDLINNAHNGDFILDQKFDAFFESVNGCKDDNLDENNPINSFVLKTPNKSQPPIVENESPIKLVLDMITPPPNVDMEHEAEPGNKDEREKNKPDGNKPEKVTKSGKGKRTTPARKKIGVENKDGGAPKQPQPDANQSTRRPSQTKETAAAAEKAKRPPGIGYDGRPLMSIKKASTPNMSSGTARPVAAPRRNSMPATTKQTPTASFMSATTKPTPTSRKLSVQNNQPNQTTPKKMETNPSTPKKTSKNLSTPKKTATKPSSVLNPTEVITSKPTCSATNPPSSSKPTTTVTKPDTSMSKPTTSTKPTGSASKSTSSTTKLNTITPQPTTATAKASTATAKASTETTKASAATTKPSAATTKPSPATTKPITTTTKPITTTTKPITTTTKPSTTTTKPSIFASKSLDSKSTVKHKGVPFLPKKVTSSASSTTSSQLSVKSTTNVTKSTTNGTKSTTNGTKPVSNSTKSTNKEAKQTTTGSKPKDNGSRPTSTNPTSKAKHNSSVPSSKSSNMITITNGRTMGKKASITDVKSETDAIAKHVIRKRNMPKTENIKQDKNGGKESKNYTIARDLIMDIVTNSV